MLKKSLLFFLLTIIFLFYAWVVTDGRLTFGLKEYHNDYYNLLSDSFLNGKLHLLVEPSKELLELPDPYNPYLNRPYRLQLHDALLYRGKYYMYWGPTPALVLHIPYMLITKLRIPKPLAVLIFTFGGLLISTAILFQLQERYFKQIPRWMVFVVVAVIGFGNLKPYLLQRPEVYEISISCACFFLLASLYCFFKAMNNSYPSFISLSLGSFFLGLSALTRYNYMFNVILLPIIWKKIIRENKDKLFVFKVTSALVAPFVICLFFIAIYNYLRFGNIFEFGLKYQLAGIDMRQLKLLDFNNLLSNLYFHLFHGQKIDLVYPFIQYAPKPGFIKTIPGYDFGGCVGIFSAIPFTLLIVIGIALYMFKASERKNSIFQYLELRMLLISACSVLFILSLLPYIQIRYLADFATLFILASAIIWFHYDLQLFAKPIKRYLFRGLVVILATISVLFSAASAFTGMEEPEFFRFFSKPLSRISNVKLNLNFSFKKPLNVINSNIFLENPIRGQLLIQTNGDIFWFSGERWLQVGKENQNITKPICYKMKVSFSDLFRDRSEPLLVSGKPGAADFVFVKYLPNSYVIFALDHWGRESFIESKPIKIIPKKIYSLEINLGGPLDPVVYMKVDGVYLFNEQLERYPVKEDQITVGVNNVGGLSCSNVFSGAIHEIVQVWGAGQSNN